MAKLITKHRRGTTDEWLASSVIIADGELVIENCENGSRKLKIGDGKSTFAQLPYVTSTIESDIELANARIDNLITLAEGNTEWPEGSVEAEVLDMRVLSDSNDDGEADTYITAGEALRTVDQKVNDLKSSLNQFINKEAVDGLYYENNMLQLTASGIPVGDPVEVIGGAGGGGGSGGAVVVRASIEGDPVFAVSKGQSAKIRFTFSATEDDVPTGNGIGTLYVNGSAQPTPFNLIQGVVNEIDVTPYLKNTQEPQSVWIKCEEGTGTGISRTLRYTITVVELTITSSFDRINLHEDDSRDITYKGTIRGNVDKVLHFIIDGEEQPSLKANFKASTQTQNFTQYIPVMEHGTHTLQVYATSELNGITVTSNILTHDIMMVRDNETEPLIASICDQTKVTQGEPIVISYRVLHPGYASCTVKLVTYTNNNGTLELYNTNEVTVDSLLQSWEITQYPVGEVVFSIEYQSLTKQHKLTSAELDIDVEAETNDLALYLSAAGKSNNSVDRDVWKYKDIETTFTGFNWESNGWVKDSKGDTCLRLTGDARIEIGYQIFATDLKPYGKTIEFEFAIQDVNNRDAVAINCFSPLNNIGLLFTSDTATLRSQTSEVTCNYKDEEKIRVSFVIEDNSNSSARLASVYLDGILSGTVQYLTTGDSFTQTSPVNIQIGSEYCGVDIYSIRIYDTALSRKQIVENYIADMSNIDDKISLYTANNIYEEYDDSQLAYDKVRKQQPTILFVGKMPSTKGDKKKHSVRMIFQHPEHPELNFDEILREIDVQGTSSAGYVRKNWKTKHYTNHVHMPNAIPAKVYCIKVDYAEATGTHNTQNANFIETLYSEKLPPQVEDSRVRSTIQGFPVITFQLDTDDPALIGSVEVDADNKKVLSSTPGCPVEDFDDRNDVIFSSKGNFNYDKGSEDAFGFNEDWDVECWEFCNNFTGLCNFVQPLDINDTNKFLTSFEARYPEACDKLERFQKMYDWVYSTRCYNLVGQNEEDENLGTRIYLDEATQQEHLAKFKSEFEEHFNLHYSLIYYVYTFFALMTDQRAKNMFLTYWAATDRWYPYFYDNDTCFGINNKGKLVFDYYHEDQDVTQDGYVFNGANSVLWYNFGICFADEIQATYSDLRFGNKLSYDKLVDQFITKGSDIWSAAIYNEDAEYKYISMARPEISGGSDITDYLYQVRGSGEHHAKYFFKNRIKYCDSKWHCGDFTVADETTDKHNTITLRLYTPKGGEATGTAVPFSPNISMTPYSDMYCGVKYGGAGYLYQHKTAKGETYTCVPTEDFSNANELETYIYGAQELSSIGDLSHLYSGYINVSAGKKLTELQIGNHHPDYSNTYLSEVSVGNNELLRKIDLTNCTGLGLGVTKSINLTGCPNIEEIYATGTNLQGIDLAPAGYIRILQLPASLRSLVLQNQVALTTDNLLISNYALISTLIIDNCQYVDATSILNECLKHKKENSDLPQLEWLRITDFDWQFTSSVEAINFFKQLEHVGGLNLSNNEQEYAYLDGKCYIPELTGEEYSYINSRYPYVQINFDSLVSNVTFYDTSRTQVLHKQTITNDELNGYNPNGKTISDPTTTVPPIIGIPSKESSAQYEYKFNGWTRNKDSNNPQKDALINILGDRELYPCFSETTRSYTVKFYSTPLHLGNVETLYGSDAILDVNQDGTPDIPIKNNTNNPEAYEFIGWLPSNKNITGPTTCYAQFKVRSDGWHEIDSSEITYDIIDDKVAITGYLGDNSVIRIPSTITHTDGKVYEIASIDGFNDTDLELVSFPDTLTVFEQEAFRDCEKLSIINISENVTDIHLHAFSGCTGLREVTYNAINAEPHYATVGAITYTPFLNSFNSQGFDLKVGSQVTNIPSHLFYQSSGDPSDNRTLNNLIFEVDENGNSDCVEIGNYSFRACYPRSITLPPNLQIIGRRAFSYNDDITELILPDSVTTIRKEAFARWNKLTSVRLPAALSSIEDSVFAHCPNLETIEMDTSNNNLFNLVNKCLIDISNPNGYKLIFGRDTFPANLNLTSIEPYAFSSAKQLTKVIIPPGVNNLPEGTFHQCSNLTSVEIKWTGSDDEGAEYNNFIVGASCFLECNSLTQITLPERTTKINSNAFNGCGLTTFTCPTYLEEIGTSAFINCRNLKTIYLNENLKVINSGAFSGCTGLTDIYCKFTADDKPTGMNESGYSMTVKIHYLGEW